MYMWADSLWYCSGKSFTEGNGGGLMDLTSHTKEFQKGSVAMGLKITLPRLISS